ncbi:MAG: AzlD domain-containing protein [Chloroflexota bacterium]|nr:AzlD domain-containing protein [Ardenticatenaceae bacterium]
MNLWIAIIGMGIITYAIRLVLLLLLERVQLPAVVQRSLAYVPTAVLSAIVFPILLQPNGTLDLSLGNARLLAGLVAAVVAWRSKNVLWTIGIGMIVLWLLQAWLS